MNRFSGGYTILHKVYIKIPLFLFLPYTLLWLIDGLFVFDDSGGCLLTILDYLEGYIPSVFDDFCFLLSMLDD